MPIVAGVIVRRIKEKISAETGHLDVLIGDRVVIETEHGQEVGVVCEREHMEEKSKKKANKILRKVNTQDQQRLKDIGEKTTRAQKLVLQKIEDHELNMKLTCIQYSFDRSKLFVYYTAESRIDFRELIKDLGHILKTRIQMVQIGVRDEAKMIGGVGHCGRQLCCQEFLKDFSSVTIEMAKDQDIPLNTAKLSGLCGRLMCCLAYENDAYRKLKRHMPRHGSRVNTPQGPGKVIGVHCLKGEVSVELQDTKQHRRFKGKEVTPKKKDS